MQHPVCVADKVTELRGKFGASIFTANVTGMDISSTDIRERVFAARSIRGLVTPGCEQFIYERGLYMPKRIRDIIGALQGRLKPSRFSHSVSVAAEAAYLAEKYGADAEKCRLAALLHDCAKLSGKDMLKWAKDVGIECDEYEVREPGLLHAKIGAYVARTEFGVDDPEVLGAIACHTVCKEKMTDVEKITYLADKLELRRDYDGVEELRAAAERSLNEAVLACIDHAEAHVLQKGETLHPASRAAREYIAKYEM